MHEELRQAFSEFCIGCPKIEPDTQAEILQHIELSQELGIIAEEAAARGHSPQAVQDILDTRASHEAAINSLPSCSKGPWTAGGRRECGRIAVVHIFDERGQTDHIRN